VSFTTNFKAKNVWELQCHRESNSAFSYWFLNGHYNSAALICCLWCAQKSNIVWLELAWICAIYKFGNNNNNNNNNNIPQKIINPTDQTVSAPAVGADVPLPVWVGCTHSAPTGDSSAPWRLPVRRYVVLPSHGPVLLQLGHAQLYLLPATRLISCNKHVVVTSFIIKQWS